MKMDRRSVSVLVDLRPAFDGYFGIPQETRQMFSLLHGLDTIEVTGLIQHPARLLARGLRSSFGREPTSTRMNEALSRVVTSTVRRRGRFGRLADSAVFARDFAWLELMTLLGIRLPLDPFDGSEFGDFLWRSLFSMSLPPSEFERCRTARYVSLWAPWQAMHATAFFPGPRKYARVDTSDFDILVAQTPWPGIVAPQTQLVVRYHDAMPMFLPHTIKRPRASQFFHISALRKNAESAAFACVSEYARERLLRIHPEIERRAFVVHNCIADDYFSEGAPSAVVNEIITSRIDASTASALGGPQNRASFYASNVVPNLRYLLSVGSLEPRKNHLGLIAAWEALRMKSKDRIALVFVGSKGWRNKSLLSAMEKWQGRGELFHLSGVSAAELRLLYSAAEVVVCPSVTEGFDIPSVEALRCGAVVAASDIPVHRELLGDAALYFDGYSTVSMSDTLARLLASDQERAELRRKAPMQAARFEKTRIAEQWHSVFDYCHMLRTEGRNAGH